MASRPGLLRAAAELRHDEMHKTLRLLRNASEWAKYCIIFPTLPIKPCGRDWLVAAEAQHSSCSWSVVAVIGSESMGGRKFGIFTQTLNPQKGIVDSMGGSARGRPSQKPFHPHSYLHLIHSGIKTLFVLGNFGKWGESGNSLGKWLPLKILLILHARPPPEFSPACHVV